MAVALADRSEQPQFPEAGLSLAVTPLGLQSPEEGAVSCIRRQKELPEGRHFAPSGECIVG